MPRRYNVNLNIQDQAAIQRARNDAIQEEFARQRLQTMDMRGAVRESSDRALVYDPYQIAQEIFVQMGIAESMTDEEKGPDSRVMRSADRKLNYGWRLLWQLAAEGNQEAMAQINLLQEEMIEYKQVRVKYLLKKVRTNLFMATFMISALLGVLASGLWYALCIPVGLVVAGIILLPYFIFVQPFIKRKAHREALGNYS